MRAIFFGTPSYAIASIRALLDAGIEVPLVCTRPARRAGRGRVASPTPIARFADDVGVPVITPDKLDDVAIDAIRAVEADVYAVVAYGRFIPSELLSIPKFGVVNVHPSLLPRHRGPSPVATAILGGDDKTGVTIMLLDEGMDTGPLLARSEPVDITMDTRSDELTERLFEMGAKILPGVLGDLEAGRLMPHPQDHAGATVARLIRKEDGVVDWDARAEQIVRMNRAFYPWPGTSTTLNGELLKLVHVELATEVDLPDDQVPGMVFLDKGGNAYVCAGGGSAVRLVTVQAAGRRAMGVEDFVVGRQGFIGAVLGR